VREKTRGGHSGYHERLPSYGIIAENGPADTVKLQMARQNMTEPKRARQTRVKSGDRITPGFLCCAEKCRISGYDRHYFCDTGALFDNKLLPACE